MRIVNKPLEDVNHDCPVCSDPLIVRNLEDYRKAIVEIFKDGEDIAYHIECHEELVG